MSPELMRDVLELIESAFQRRPAPIEFEVAYHVRVAIDRIRFAIRHTEQYCPQSEQVREAEFQLLDALERLENVDRGLQERSRIYGRPPASKMEHENVRTNEDFSRQTEANGNRKTRIQAGAGGNVDR